MRRPIADAPNSGADNGFWQRLVLAVLLTLLLILQGRLWWGTASWAEVAELEERLDARRTENRRLASDNAALRAEVLALKSRPEHLEGRARSELGMIREGETFFMVVPEAERRSVASP